MIGGLSRRRRGRARLSTAHRGPCSRSRADRRARASLTGGQAAGRSGSSRETASTRCSTTSDSASTRSRTASTSRLPRFRACAPPAASAPSRAGRRSFRSCASRRSSRAVDIGACEGYFSIMLGEAGIPTIALEGAPGAARTAMLAVRRSGLDDVGVLALSLTPSNVVAVPASDCTLLLLHLAPPRAQLRARRGDRDDGDDLEPDRQGALLRHGRERDDARLRAAGDDARRALLAQRPTSPRRATARASSTSGRTRRSTPRVVPSSGTCSRSSASE